MRQRVRHILAGAIIVCGACSGAAPQPGGAPAALPGQGGSSSVPANADPELAGIYQTIVQQEMPRLPFDILAGAKKEGHVVLYQTARDNANDQVIQQFQQRFPFVRVDTFEASSAPLLQRFLTEKRAGSNRVDVLQQNSALDLQDALEEGFIDTYTVTSESMFRPESFSSGHWYATAHATVIVYAYNTNLVSEKQAAALTSYDGFWSPGLRGKKVAVPNAASAINAQQWFYRLERIYGADVWQKIKALDYRVYEGGVPASSALSRGEVAIAPLSESQALIAWSAKAPIRWTVPLPAIAQYQSQAVVKNAPNPHAARLLQEFMLSKAGQSIFATYAYPSARSDVPELRPVATEPWFLGQASRRFFNDGDPAEVAAFTQRKRGLVQQWKGLFGR